MRCDRCVLVAGALLGLSGIVAGASLDHAAAKFVLQQHAADAALRYHQLNAIIITALGLVLAFFPLDLKTRWRLAVSGEILTLGTLIFCGSLYALAFTGKAYAAYGAPIGGFTLMVGWAALVWAAFKHRPKN